MGGREWENEGQTGSGKGVWKQEPGWEEEGRGGGRRTGVNQDR